MEKCLNKDAMLEEYPRLSSACYIPPLDFPIARCHFNQSNLSFVKGVLRSLWYDPGVFTFGSD